MIGNSFASTVGSTELVEKLLNDEQLVQSSVAKEGLNQMKLLLHYCDIFGVTDKVSTADKKIPTMPMLVGKFQSVFTTFQYPL